jgi:hypothetical protein
MFAKGRRICIAGIQQLMPVDVVEEELSLVQMIRGRIQQVGME